MRVTVLIAVQFFFCIIEMNDRIVPQIKIKIPRKTLKNF